MRRHVFIGGVDFSAACLETMLRMGLSMAGIFCLEKGAASANSDYADLGEVARKFGKPCRYFSRIKDEAENIRALEPDVIFVMGLSQIIPPEILGIPSIGTIGSHPALLPRNRGRHPIIWAIANGLTQSGLTLFWLDSGIDTGDIWAQEEFAVGPEDDASTVYERVKGLASEMLKAHIPELEKGIARRRPQDSSLANTFRKRTTKDGEIDWRMGTKRICDLIRALYRPYPGAHCIHNGREVKVWRGREFNITGAACGLEPGKVLSSNLGSIVVKTGDSAIELIEHGFERFPAAGEYL
ncbi:MAG: methionyl-tRNA formyltransferase [Candidatus Methylomirabilis sp.]|nr:methionyl-tRNA formyltransferase [Deltaproteobacteria bacterium]